MERAAVPIARPAFDYGEVLASLLHLCSLDDVTASVRINQGDVDTRTPIVGVQRYVDELSARGGDVVLDVFEGGHEPTGLDGAAVDQRRMHELVRRTLAGERWDG